MAQRVALMLPLAVAAAVTHTRRTALRHAASTIAAVAAPAGAKELYYTKEEFCRISDEQSKNGIEFGCEQYVESPEKRARMRARALDAISRASAKLDTYRVETAESGAVIRGALRRDPLDGLRAQGRRLATLTKTSDAGLKYDDAIARVDALDRTLRRLEIDGSDRALAAAATDLDGRRARCGRSWPSAATASAHAGHRSRAASPDGAAAGRPTRRASTSRGRAEAPAALRCASLLERPRVGETRSRAPDAQLA